MYLFSTWAKLGLRTRLLVAIGFVLVVIGIVELLYHAQTQSAQYRQDMAHMLSTKLDVLQLAIQDHAIAGDRAAIEQTLRAGVKLSDVDFAEWRSNDAQSLRAENFESAKAPAWFQAYTGIASSVATRALSVGSRTYGELMLGMSGARWTNRLWLDFMQHLLTSAIEFALIFGVVAIVLGSGLGSLSSLLQMARRFRAGHYGERGQFTPGMAPEARNIVEAVNQTADHLAQILHAVQGASDAISICDLDGKAIFINHAFAQMFGLTLEEINAMGGTAAALNHPTLTQIACPLAKQGQGWSGRLEFDIRGKGKRTVFFRSGPAFNEKQALVGVLAIITDITEQLRSTRMNEWLVRILDDTLEEIYIFDAETLRFVRVNRGACANLGYTAEELHALRAFDLKPLMSREEFEAVIAPLRRGEAGHIQFKTIHQRKDGSTYPVEARLKLFQAATGQVFCGIVQDISTRQAVERELVQSRDALRKFSAHLQQAREEEKSKIAREIHDELGGTLTALKMDAYWLSSKLTTEQVALQQKTQTMLVSIDAAVHATRRIVTELRPTILDDLGLAAAMQWQAREFELRTGIACNIIFPSAEPVLDDTRAIALFRILQEALTNIAKHARAKEVAVCYESSDEAVTLIIRDDGCGISADAMSHADSHGIRGMMERAQYLNGEVRVTAGPSKGTVVSVCLPNAPRVES